MKNFVTILCALAMATALAFPALAAEAPQPLQPAAPQIVPMDAAHWDIQAEEQEFAEYQGKAALKLGKGMALVKGLTDFTDGVVEFDIAVPEKRGFSGPIWRVQDPKNFEEFYLRHHQSGNEDANQYSPVFNGLAGWQLYYSADGFGFPLSYPPGQWMHMKLVLSGPELEVYLDDMETPIVYVPKQRRAVSPGRLGFRCQVGAPAYFADFSFTPMANPPMKRMAKQAPDQPKRVAQWAENAKRMRGASEPISPGIVVNWEVSEALKMSDLTKLGRLNTKDVAWTRMKADETGLLDLSKVKGVAERLDKDGEVLVLCRTQVHSNMRQTKRMEFGFSDQALVYVNGTPVYEGSDSYRSRDYRFLGSVGYYDAVFLPLNVGRNQIIFAVGEKFGGFGIKVRFPDPSEMMINRDF